MNGRRLVVRICLLFSLETKTSFWWSISCEFLHRNTATYIFRVPETRLQLGSSIQAQIASGESLFNEFFLDINITVLSFVGVFTSLGKVMTQTYDFNTPAVDGSN